jgi:acetyltransferase-like isoleucine patch superfamily enzyme
MKISKGIRGLFIRFLQMMAYFCPGATSLRLILHRMRGVKIGRNVFIGTACLVETGKPENITIGNNVIISMRVTIVAHFKQDFAPNPQVVIEDNVFIGPGTIVLPNVRIGQGSVVMAGSVVYANVKPGQMVRGNPAVPIATCKVPLTQPSYAKYIRGLQPIK